jgi:uncharacterized damage-inducible protein DinB
METTIKEQQIASVITSNELLNHWQGHRRLTRRVIEAFPEKDLFSFSIGGMRPFSDMIKELLAIAVPGLKEVVGGSTEAFNEQMDHATSKEILLKLWDEATDQINHYWAQISDDRFRETIVAFGQYEGTVWSTIFYFIDNEIHHRAQGYTYLRALGVQPPFFWER